MNVPFSPASEVSQSGQSGRRMLAVILLSVAVANGAAMRTLLSPIGEAAKRDLGISDLRMSLLQGAAVALPMVVLALPLGWLVDHFSRAKLLACAALAGSAGGALIASGTGFATLFVARAMIALGSVCALPAAISLAADLSRPDRRGRTVLLVSLGSTVGTALAFTIGGRLLALLNDLAAAGRPLFGVAPWRAAHLVFASAGLIVLALLLFLREPPRRETGAGAATTASIGRELWSRRWFLLALVVAQNSAVMADTAATIWAAPVLIRGYGIGPERFAGWLGLTVILAGAIGAVAGGLLADLGRRAARRGGLFIGAVGAAVIAVPASLFAVAPDQASFAALLTVLLLSGAITSVITSTAVAVLLPNEIRGTCLSGFVVVGGLVGFGLAPTLITIVSSWLGGGGHLGQALAVTGLCVSSLSLLAFVAAMRSAPLQVGEIGREDVAHG